MSRWIKFIIFTLLGLGLGLLYGWVVSPVSYVDTTPDSLRVDYKADYVLMVAEIYRVEGDVEMAARRLVFMGEDSPQVSIGQALAFASEQGYSPTDVSLLRSLGDALQSWDPITEGAVP